MHRVSRLLMAISMALVSVTCGDSHTPTRPTTTLPPSGGVSAQLQLTPTRDSFWPGAQRLFGLINGGSSATVVIVRYTRSNQAIENDWNRYLSFEYQSPVAPTAGAHINFRALLSWPTNDTSHFLITVSAPGKGQTTAMLVVE